jgi:hypothetical protein
MPTTTEYDQRQDRIAALLENTIKVLGPDLVGNPELQEILNRMVDQQIAALEQAENAKPLAADAGIADLIGLGPGAPTSLGATQVSGGVKGYEDALTSDRILSTADLYYIYMHEKIGIFKVVYKLQELFRAGTLRISGGPGAYGLYRFDKHSILRYHLRDRMRAYKRVFGYTRSDPGPNARANPEFHGLFTHFIGETAKFWRDKRISEVIRDNASDPTFGSIAIVRRAGLDLRNNVKNSSYGFVNVLRIETSQALAEAFKVLDAPDIKAQFGADHAWDVLELVLWQYFHQSVNASAMNRMAMAGREILRWLAESYVLTNDRTTFETYLFRIAEYAEEWMSSDEGMRLSRPTPPPRNVYHQGPPPSGARRDPVFARSNGRMPAASVVG